MAYCKTNKRTTYRKMASIFDTVPHTVRAIKQNRRTVKMYMMNPSLPDGVPLAV